MSNIMFFQNREEFRKWLYKNCTSIDGIWILFGKASGPKTLTAAEALEEALCFGWIDGQIQKIDDKTYKKYFSIRRKDSNWSEKNKLIAKKLEENGLMTDFGKNKIDEAKKNGQWYVSNNILITEEQIKHLYRLLEEHEKAYENFKCMSLSIKKTYAKAYFSAKTDLGKEKRLLWIIDRLNNNLKPM